MEERMQNYKLLSSRMRVRKQMVAKLEDEIHECKRASFEINERLNKIELKEALKEEKIGHNETRCT